jgi:hypothetical protein
VRIYFSEGGVDINYENPFMFKDEMSIPARIVDFIKSKGGNVSLTELTDEMNDVNKQVLKNKLQDLKKRNLLDNPNKGYWTVKDAGQLQEERSCGQGAATPKEDKQMQTDQYKW